MSGIGDNSEPSLTPVPPGQENSKPTKDEAETAKLVAESEKLAAEAKYLARPFWQRTEALGLIGSFLVAAVGLGGVIYTQSIREQSEDLQRKSTELETKKVELDAKKTELDASKRDLEAERNSLGPTIDELKRQRAGLESEQGTMETNVATLSEKAVAEKTELENQIERNEELRTTANSLRSERDRLQTEAQYAQIDALIDQMEYDYARSSGSRVDESVRRLLRTSSAEERPRLVARCEERANRPNVGANARMHIYDMLDDVTHDPRFKAELLKFAERYFFATTDDVSEKTLSEYQNVIDGFIVPNTLDAGDARLLANALWNDKLEFGRDLANASSGQLESFLALNRHAMLENPEAFLRTVAQIQQRLETATDPQTMLGLARILSDFEPQCLVLTWYFGPDKTGWKSSTKEVFETAERRLRDSGIGRYEPWKLMPTPDGPIAVSAEAWKAANGKLIKIWVPIDYDEQVYEPVIPLIRQFRPISLSDFPDN